MGTISYRTHEERTAPSLSDWDGFGSEGRERRIRHEGGRVPAKVYRHLVAKARRAQSLPSFETALPQIIAAIVADGFSPDHWNDDAMVYDDEAGSWSRWPASAILSLSRWAIDIGRMLEMSPGAWAWRLERFMGLWLRTTHRPLRPGSTYSESPRILLNLLEAAGGALTPKGAAALHQDRSAALLVGPSCSKRRLWAIATVARRRVSSALRDGDGLRDIRAAGQVSRAFAHYIGAQRLPGERFRVAARRLLPAWSALQGTRRELRQALHIPASMWHIRPSAAIGMMRHHGRRSDATHSAKGWWRFREQVSRSPARERLGLLEFESRRDREAVRTIERGRSERRWATIGLGRETVRAIPAMPCAEVFAMVGSNRDQALRLFERMGIDLYGTIDGPMIIRLIDEGFAAMGFCDSADGIARHILRQIIPGVERCCA